MAARPDGGRRRVVDVITCEEVADAALEYVEGGLSRESSLEVRDHLQRCEQCSDLVKRTRDIVGGFGEARSLERAVLGSESATARVGTHRELGPLSTLGDFEIVEKLGQGGMGVVYRARQISLRREVALKVLPLGVGADDDGIARFHREAQAAARLHHTNIVPIYAEGCEQGRFYYAMELIHGPSLASVLAADARARSARGGSSQRSLGGRDFKRLARQVAEVAEALHHAHEQGVVHRDIKPHNLLLGRDDRLHITDFGLARLLDQPGMTLTGDNPGTPAYMAPEQVLGRKNVDGRADVFSLGVTLYEMLTLERPFVASTRDGVMQQVLRRDPRDPRRIDSRIPQDLETICLRAMEKEPERRFTSALDLAHELRRYATDYPIVSRRIGLLQRALRWVRRHPAWATTIASVVVLGSTVAAVAHRWRVSETQRREQAYRNSVAQADAKLIEARELLLKNYRSNRDEARDLLAAPEVKRFGDPKRYALAEGLAMSRGSRQELERAIKLLEPFAADPEAQALSTWIHVRLAEKDPAWRPITDRALDDSRHLAESAKSDAVVQFYLGQAWMTIDPYLSHAALTRAVEHRSQFTQAMLHLGRAANTLYYFDQSIETLRDAESGLRSACQLMAGEGYPHYLYSINLRMQAMFHLRASDADGYEALMQRSLKEARAAYQASDPDGNGYAAEAEYWEARGDYESALRARRELKEFCERIRPHNADALLRNEVHALSARLHFWLNRNNDAIREMVLQYGPRDWSGRPVAIDPEAAMMIALIRRSDGDSAAAGEWLDACTAALPVSRMDRLRLEIGYRVCGIPAPAALWSRSDDPSLNLPIRWTPAFLNLLVGLVRAEGTTWQQVEAHVGEIKEVGDRRRASTGALFFKGMLQLSEGRRDRAFETLRTASEQRDFENYCFWALMVHRKMELDPSWPEWIPIHVDKSID